VSKYLDRIRRREAEVERSQQEAGADANRYQPLWTAFQAVREATPTELGLSGRAFYQAWAERVCRVGTELTGAGLTVWLADRQATTDPAEALAVEIYRLGVEGKAPAIVELLMETFHLDEADADNQAKIASRGAVNAWLRRRLAEALEHWLVPRRQPGPILCSPLQQVPSHGPEAATAAPAARRVESGGPTRAARPRFESYALAVEHAVSWHWFKRFGDQWRHQGRAQGIRKGRQADLLNDFAFGGGHLSGAEAQKLVRQTASRDERRRIMQIIKPEISRLRRHIRQFVGVAGRTADPLPWDRHARAWQAVVQIGYAVQTDEGRLEFKLKEHLSREEALDV
jgi:hypothetical protein